MKTKIKIKSPIKSWDTPFLIFNIFIVLRTTALVLEFAFIRADKQSGVNIVPQYVTTIENDKEVSGLSEEDDFKESSALNSKSETSKSSSEKVVLKDNTSYNLNTATKEELMSLPGIGEAKANAILSLRDSLGGFKDLKQLKDVKGIGDAIYKKISPYLHID